MKSNIIDKALTIDLAASKSLDNLENLLNLMSDLYILCSESDDYDKIIEQFFINIKQNIFNNRIIYKNYRTGVASVIGCMGLVAEAKDYNNEKILKCINSKCAELYEDTNLL